MAWTNEYAGSVRKSVHRLDRQVQCHIRDFLELRLGGLIVSVVQTDRDGRIRIITARRARKNEQREYQRIFLGDAIRRRGEGKTDWGRLRREAAAGLEPERDPDEGGFDWSRARVDMPRPKQVISVRLDADVLDFFRAGGRGYQTRINAILRSYMEALQT